MVGFWKFCEIDIGPKLFHSFGWDLWEGSCKQSPSKALVIYDRTGYITHDEIIVMICNDMILY